MHVGQILRMAAICELSIGAWLLVFAGTSIARTMDTGSSSSFLWLVLPMAVLGLLILTAGLCALWDKPIASGALLALVLACSVVRWIANWRYVFPFGEPGVASAGTPLTMRIWQTQQFVLVVVIVLLLLLTIHAIRARQLHQA